jgi:hypothetical protein
MRKLIVGLIVAAAMAVPATPAFAIHHGVLGFVPECAQSDQALGGPPGSPASVHTQGSAHANPVLSEHNHADPPCNGD